MKLLEYNFFDLYINDQKEFYISDEKHDKGVQKVVPEDKDRFYNKLISIEHNENSYSFCYEDTIFRIEYVKSIKEVFYCLRRMPKEVPNIHNIGFDEKVVKYLLSLSKSSGLVIFGGSTGSGKTTSISSLLKEYLNLDGGFAYTIEDPAELPLEGEYTAFNGSMGLCRQIEVIKQDWGTPLKSALRSSPRCILIGEIRTPEAAAECLRASISGHLVLTTIHANTIVDILSSLIKYASTVINEATAYEMLSHGLLAAVKQELVLLNGKKQPNIETLFTNPDSRKADPVRFIISCGKLNLATQIEQQAIRLQKNIALFES